MSSRHCEGRVVHASLIRPILFGGMEQGIAMLVLIAAVGIPMYGGFHPIIIGIAVLLAFPLHALGVWLAKKDPQMVGLYVRSMWAKDFYLPYGAMRTRSPVVRASIPGAY